MLDLRPGTRALLVRLRNMDLARPRVDREAAEGALLRHLDALLETRDLLDSDRVARLVRVACPSTGQRYVLRVPPELASAHEGVAWTFGMERGAYRPDAET